MRLPLLASLLLVTACDDDFALPPSPADTVANVLALTGNANTGEALYNERCFACHNPASSNPIGPDLADGSVASTGDEELLDIIINGKNAMPKFRGWDNHEYADLLAYLRSEYGGPGDTDDTGEAAHTGDTGEGGDTGVGGDTGEGGESGDTAGGDTGT